MEITFLPTNISKLHLHVEQLLKNTYRMLAEDLRLPKRQETPHVPGRAKEKRKNAGKRIGMGPAPLGGSCEGGKVSTHSEAPSLAGTRGGRGVSCGATEDRAATGLQRAKWRDFHTEDQCQPALTSPRGLSAHPPGWAGAGS